MATLDKVMELQRQGISDTEISRQLQNEGVSPAEISNSMNQAKVKNAISPSAAPEGAPAQPAMEMQQSIMQGGADQGMATGTPEQSGQPAAAPTQPMTQEVPAAGPPMQMPPQDMTAQNPEIYQAPQPQDNYYQQTPQAYDDQGYYAPAAGADTETISEIAEQVVSEKFNEYKAKTGDMVSFKNSIQEKVSDIDERLKRIENSIEKLQQAIIGKVGEFGENSAMIHKDLENLHGTMSKMMNPLVDNFNELRKIAGKK